MSTEHKIVKVGSRKSELALIQTHYVIALLKKYYPNYDFQIVTMNTLGDQILDKALPKIGEKSLFTKELEIALAAECVDFVVHSLKDLPTCLPDGMAIGAVLKREDPRDALVIRSDLNESKSLQDLKDGSVIGTSSLRRTAQLNRMYPHLKVENIRGNLNTRLKKLDDLNHYSGIVLAKAGLIRMGWSSRISQVLNDMMYAVGQGALAVECRENDKDMIDVLSILHDERTLLQALAERSFLRTLGGGCSAPVAVRSEFKENNLILEGAVWSLDGTTLIQDKDFSEYAIEKKEHDIQPVEFPKPVTTDSSIRKCPFNNTESPSKKLKTDSAPMTCPYAIAASTSADSCPMSSLPVGVDFMGKCPYLDDHQVSTKCPVNAEVIDKSLKVEFKCPHLSGNKISEPQVQSSKVYCGLVGSKFVSTDVLESIETLGLKLAEKLMERGAKTVMDEAQSHIRGAHQINQVVVK